MKRFVLPMIATALLACPAVASEPQSARVAKLVKHVTFERQTGIREDEIVIPPQARPMPRHRPLHLRMMEFVGNPITPIVQYLASPNTGLRRLLNESEDLQAARKAFQRLLMNKPATLTYERLQGNIGP